MAVSYRGEREPIRARLWVMIVGGALTLCPGAARAQAPVGPPGLPVTRLNGWFAAPGYYGMSYGVPSYGSVRTYSEFSSPYGAGYAYGIDRRLTIMEDPGGGHPDTNHERKGCGGSAEHERMHTETSINEAGCGLVGAFASF